MRAYIVLGFFIGGAVAGCAAPGTRATDAQRAQAHDRADEVFARASRDGNARSERPPTARWLLAADAPASRTTIDEELSAPEDGAAQEQRYTRARGPLPDLSDTIARDLAEAPADLWEDTKSVYGNGRNLIILGLTYGGSVALQATGVDDRFESSFNSRRVFSEDLGEGIAFLGNPAAHFGLAGLWYLVGQQQQNERTYSVGRTLFSALTINGVTSMLGHVATWDKSPNGEFGTFPSGHTSSTFTVASVMHEAYGPWVGVPLYGLGVAVAAERLDNGEHYFSDVVMGAVLGLVIGHTVAGEHEIEVFGGQIVPYADPQTGASGIAWHVQF